MEKLYKEKSSGPYYLGEHFSMAEIAWVPFLDRFSATLSHYRSFDVFAGRNRLKEAYEATKCRPSFARTCQTREFYIQIYASYAGVLN